ncbi:hypothetical protein D3C72_592830 [compost metagenome]
MPGERRLNRHFSGFKVTDLADHDDVRVLPHQRTHPGGEAQVDVVLHLHLVERRLDHFDRVFDGAEVHFRRRQFFQRGVQRGGLARTGRPGDQNDAVGLAGHVLPAAQIVGTETQLVEILEQHFRVENPHDHFFAERGGQRRKAQLHFTAVRGLGLDPAVLGFALLGDVHPPEAFQATDNCHGHLRRELIDVVQHAVDAKAHRALFTPRLDVDIAGALLEGVLEQPVDDVDDVRIVGIRLLIAGAEVEQLFEVAEVTALLIGIAGAADRFGQAEELDAEALDIRRVGHHPFDRQLQYVGEIGLPAGDIRLGTGHGHRIAVDRHGENLVPLCEGVGHQRCDRGDVDLQRVNTQVRLAGLLRQPQGQAFQVEVFAWPAEVVELLAGDELQRMHLSMSRETAAGIQRLLRRVLANKPLGDQFTQHFVEFQPAVLSGKLNGHAGFLLSDSAQKDSRGPADRWATTRRSRCRTCQPAACVRASQALSAFCRLTEQTLIRLRSFSAITCARCQLRPPMTRSIDSRSSMRCTLTCSGVRNCRANRLSTRTSKSGSASARI